MMHDQFNDPDDPAAVMYELERDLVEGRRELLKDDRCRWDGFVLDVVVQFIVLMITVTVIVVLWQHICLL